MDDHSGEPAPITFAGRSFSANKQGRYWLNEILIAAQEAGLVPGTTVMPSEFRRSPSGRAALAAEAGNPGAIRSSSKGGTRAVRSIAMAYARWISPTFGMQIDATDALGAAVRLMGFEVPAELAGWATYTIRDEGAGLSWAGIDSNPAAVLLRVRRTNPHADLVSVQSVTVRPQA
jgi:hypothetical protein